jgi:hypothetical protein
MKGIIKAICSYSRRGIYLLPRLPVDLLEAAFFLAARRIWPNEVKKGIRIFDPDPQTLPHSVKTICEALELIEQNDSRRFERIKREIHIIVRFPTVAPAAYSRFTKSCRVDLARFPLTENPDFERVLLACLLVHESTHGYLCRRGIMHTKRLYERTEMACWKEEVRFALKLGYNFRDFVPTEHNLKDPRLLERFMAMHKDVVFANRRGATDPAE